MKSNERFKILNKIRNNTNLIRKCQICGKTSSETKVETLINEVSPNKVKFVCTVCRYAEDTKSLIDKLPEINIDDFVTSDIKVVNLDKLTYSDKMKEYIDDALQTDLVKTRWLREKEISDLRFSTFVDLYEKHNNVQIRQQLNEHFMSNKKQVRVKTLNNKDVSKYSNNIHKFRLEQNLSLRQLSIKTDLALTDVAIYYIAEGDYKPKKKAMLLISKALNKSPEEVFPNDWTEEE